jgi:hypothetical protein
MCRARLFGVLRISPEVADARGGGISTTLFVTKSAKTLLPFARLTGLIA